MKPRTKRFALIAAGIVVLCAAAAFVLNAFQSNLVFFFTPTQVSNGEAPKGRTFRAGGMVKEGSLVRDNAAAGGGNTVRFVITDTVHEMPVTYVGLLPDLFKEGKGVVAQGKLGDDGVFVASEVLAKHDENYMPPEAQHAMDQATAAKAAKSVQTPAPVKGNP
jgi:cytochrome c-type biogenesis protein CcmE